MGIESLIALRYALVSEARSFRPWLRQVAIAAAVVFLVTACATAESGPGDEPAPGADEAGSFSGYYENDPLELPNRFVFAFNEMLDFAVFRPVAVTYRFLVPEPVRDSVRNFLRNLSTPVVLANDLLQGEFGRAETTATRFAINSTAGLLGLFDVAEDMGYVYHDEDFGQTLAVYGMGEVVYLVLPVFGPSSVRDGIGLVVDRFLDPLTYVAENNDAEDWLLVRSAVRGIDFRHRNIETLDDLKRDSIDYYARIRSLYRQTRANEINNGVPAAGAPTPGFDTLDFEFDTEDEQPGTSPN